MNRYQSNQDDQEISLVPKKYTLITLVIAIGIIFVLLLFIGFNTIKVEKNNTHFEKIFTETKTRIQKFSEELKRMQKQNLEITQETKKIGAQLLKAYSQKVIVLDKTIKKADKTVEFTKNQKSQNSKAIGERIQDLQRSINDINTLQDFIQNCAKEVVRQTKQAQFQKIVKGDYFKPQKKRNPWMMSKNNLKSPFIDFEEQKSINDQLEKEQSRLESTYHMTEYSKELPFCIVVPSYNNAKNFRFQYNLQSIINQQYSNYRVVIVDDASPDNTTYLIKRFMRKNKISPERVVLITNKKQVTAVPNIHMAITKHCKPNEIAFFVDGDDELVGQKVFQVFNAVYQKKNPAIAYSISLQYWVYDKFVKDGWSKPYTDEQKQNNMYRDVSQKISHLRSFRVDLYLEIKERDLKDINGEWFTSTYDEVICLPMLEMSCGNIEYIDDYLYLYVYGTGFNDRLVDSVLQWSIAKYVKTKMPKYVCNKKFAKVND